MTSLPIANFRWKGPTRGILRNFRLGMRTPFHPFGCPSVTGSHGTCTTTLVVIQNEPVEHAHTITSSQALFRSLTSLPVKRRTRGITKFPVAHTHNILPVPDRTSSGSGQGLFRSRHFRLLPTVPPQIWLCPYPYTTHVSSFK
jgi:hypothetical protein